MKLMICGDDAESVTYIQNCVREFCEKSGIEMISGSSKQLIKEMDDNLFCYDIVILNVENSIINLNGVTLGKMINEKYPCCQIIFCVDDYNCIPEFYEVEHCFLLSQRDVKAWGDKAMNKALSKINENGSRHYIEFMFERKPVILSQALINYIEREQRVVNIHTDAKKYQIYTSIKEIADQLDDDFVRCQGGFIVNLRCIESVSAAGILMSSGTIIPVGKTYKEKFRSAYKEYIEKHT